MFIFGGKSLGVSVCGIAWFSFRENAWHNEQIAKCANDVTGPTPPALDGAAAVFYEPQNSIFVFGGRLASGDISTQVYRYDVS